MWCTPDKAKMLFTVKCISQRQVGRRSAKPLHRSLASLHAYGGALCSVTCSQRKYHHYHRYIIARRFAKAALRCWCLSQAHPPSGSVLCIVSVCPIQLCICKTLFRHLALVFWKPCNVVLLSYFLYELFTDSLFYVLIRKCNSFALFVSFEP